MTEWRACVCRPSSSVRVDDANAFVKESEAGRSISAIDEFYAELKRILNAVPPDYLDEHPSMGPFAFVGVVAVTEEYIRALLGSIIGVCPISQAKASGKSINLGSAVWHGSGVLSRGAFEHMSFASADAIKKTLRDFVGVEVKKSDRVHGVLDEFETICEVRHAAVHSGVSIPGKNALKLNLYKGVDRSRLSIGFSEVQLCASICTELAVSLNLDLFQEMVRRWATEWRECASWSDSKANAQFRVIWDLFHSQFDHEKGLIQEPLTIIKCRNRALREFIGS